MFTYSGPPKRRLRKPLTTATAKQFRSEERLRRFDQAMVVFFGVMGVILFFEIM